ncbi:hypothetical protein HBI56_036910 [Parastagonospora nodorum]|nr:hypothetical protein HBH53_016130 [Parastagonospora nodorum]KAH3986438.1 hypothetical protein HBH52_047290 [Parastagonospora nodorum]KAH3988252.1 hypothetical protein HBH51_001790 [Parastagonospora nodorum]KAH4004592.1 hypothetical protein HBI10_040290 [Parastagonospora nodorum]KAH4030703.1 hypothetical protein HBI13_023740 [Parastagonospora nodorum]
MSRINGLYPMPGNMYRSAPSGPRPSFNTKSFASPEPEPAPKEVVAEAALTVNDLASVKLKKDKKSKRPGADANGKTPIPLPPNVSERNKKKTKKASLGTEGGNENTETAPASGAPGDAAATETEDEDESKPKKKKKRSLNATVEDEVIEIAPSADATSATTAKDIEKPKSSKKTKDRDGAEAQQSEKKAAKKRKRASEVPADTSSKAPEDTVLGGEYFQNLEAAIGRKVADFDSPQASAPLTEAPAKKKAKTKRKHSENEAAPLQEEQMGGAPVEPAMEVTPSEDVLAKKDRKEKKEKKRKRRESQQVLADTVEPSSATVQGDPPKPVPNIEQRKPKAGSSFIKEPRNTPIPLPSNSSLGVASTAASPHRTQKMRDDPQVLVVETTPLRKTVASSLSQATTAPAGQIKSKKAPAVKASSAKPVNGSQPSASAPAALPEPKAVLEKSYGQTSLTTSNLERYTQPLSDQAKPRPRSGRSSSVSSTSSMSIKEAFARVPKPSSTPVTSKTSNPFLAPVAQEKVEKIDNQKANLQLFDSTLAAFRSSVNMIDEQVYLNQHLELRAANDAAGPLPCLKSATGCTPKNEEHIRALKDSNSKTTPSFIDPHQLALDVSIAAAVEAEKFLHNAVVTGIPVPAGDLEGTYKIYCSKYTDTHADKYGFGQRKLVISKPAGFFGNTYTARLITPPRPMGFTVLSFEVPPNASFRTIRLTTSADNYTMDLVVLGNGHILLQVDIGLFLTGRRTATGMEFVGIKEGATKWAGLEDVKTAERKNIQRMKELVEKEAREKEEDDKAWAVRKEEMARLKASGVESSPVKPETPTKPKSTANGSSKTPTKPKTTTGTNGVLKTPTKSKTPAKPMMSGALPSSKKLKTPVVDGVSPSPKKRGRPTNAEIVRRAMEAAGQTAA